MILRGWFLTNYLINRDDETNQIYSSFIFHGIRIFH